MADLYENYILPSDMNKNRESLIELKRREFSMRKKTLNPYQRKSLEQEALGDKKREEYL